MAYHGVPDKAYEVFVNALQSTFLSQGIDIPPLEDHNPAGVSTLLCTSTNTVLYTNTRADVIMDMLGDRKMRKIVNSYYEESGEQDLVKKAVWNAQSKEKRYIEEVDGTSAKANPISAKLKTWKYVNVMLN